MADFTRDQQQYLRDLEDEYSPQRRRNIVRGRVIGRRAGGGAPITVVSSANPSITGSSVTFTATVWLPGNPTGTVSFFDGVTQIGSDQALTGTPPRASIATAALTLGGHQITARYNGDATHGVARSAVLSQTVSAIATTTALTSSLNPSSAGNSVTFTASVTGGGTGNVMFFDGGTSIGTVALSGATAALTTAALGAGSHNITASYNGDATHAASSSQAVEQVVFALYSERSVINMNFVDGFSNEFVFINFVKSSFWGFTNTVDLAQVDVNGYSKLNTMASGGGLYLPSSSDLPGLYVLTWTGKGTVEIPDPGTWTIDVGQSSNYTQLANGRWSGTNPRIVMSLTGHTFEGPVAIRVLSTDPDVTGDYVRDLKLYQLADEADLLAGKVFRRGWKQLLVDLNPAAIRAMNWSGGAASVVVRWSHRTPVNNVSYDRVWQKSPAYPASSGTGDIVVGSATGMPVSMQHGEIAQFRLTNDVPGQNPGNPIQINSISKEANALVTTATAHGFSDGQKVVFDINMGQAGSMHQMHKKVAIVASATATTFRTGVDTTTFDNFVATGARNVTNHTTLNVGGRGAFPVLFNDTVPVTNWGQYLRAGAFNSYVFDKYLIGDRDVGAGAWLIVDAPSDASNFYIQDGGRMPPELCVALVNELNEMKSGGEFIDLWVTLPHKGLMSVDPDYNAGDNFPVNYVDVCLNGAGGYLGLTPGAKLWVEYSNETWNGSAAFHGAIYCAAIGQVRYGGPTTPFVGGNADYNSFATVRAMQMHQELLAAFAAEHSAGRLKIVAAGQGTYGMVNGSGSPNDIRVNGNSNTLNDPWNSGATAPWQKFDAFAWASYFQPSDGDDFSVYLASIDDYAADFAAAAGNPTTQEAICSDWIVNVLRPRGEGTGRYGNVVLPQFASVLGALGRITMQYEGGQQWPTTGNPTTAIDNFLVGVRRSQAWADEQIAFFAKFRDTANAYMPSVYILIDHRWGYTVPYKTTFLGGVEGGALTKTWAAMGTFNDSVDG